MRIVFLGTPEFATTSLDILVKNGMEVVGVITAPDRPAGRDAVGTGRQDGVAAKESGGDAF